MYLATPPKRRRRRKKPSTKARPSLGRRGGEGRERDETRPTNQQRPKATSDPGDATGGPSLTHFTSSASFLSHTHPKQTHTPTPQGRKKGPAQLRQLLSAIDLTPTQSAGPLAPIVKGRPHSPPYKFPSLLSHQKAPIQISHTNYPHIQTIAYTSIPYKSNTYKQAANVSTCFSMPAHCKIQVPLVPIALLARPSHRSSFHRLDPSHWI